MKTRKWTLIHCVILPHTLICVTSTAGNIHNHLKKCAHFTVVALKTVEVIISIGLLKLNVASSTAFHKEYLCIWEEQGGFSLKRELWDFKF